MVAKDVGATASDIGYDGLSTGDGATQARVAAQLINAAGGVGGRAVVPVVHEIDFSSAETLAQQFQAGCSKFFEDNDAEALVSLFIDDVLATCAAKAGAPYVAGPVNSWSERRVRTLTAAVLSTMPTIEAAAQALSSSLAQQGWFQADDATEKVAIGLLTHDDPQYTQVKPVVERALRAAGLTLADTAYMPVNKSAADLSRASSAGRAAALRFSSKGINRVVIVDQNGFAASWFAIGAASQSYYPRLGMSSLSQPGTEPDILSPESLAGSAGIGWAPFLDVQVSDQTGTSQRTPQCLKAMQSAGQKTDTNASRLGIIGLCDATWLLADASRSAGMTTPGFVQGLAQLGTGFRSVATFATDFSRSRAAVTHYRALSYVAACDCFRYSGPLRPL